METLDTVNLILRFPLYSGWSRKNFVVILLPANVFAMSSDGNKTSQVAKLLRQKYLPRISAVFCNSSNASFLKNLPVSLFSTKDRVFGSTASTSSGIGRNSLCLKYFVNFSTLFLSQSLAVFFSIWADLETGEAGAFCAGRVDDEADDNSSSFSKGSSSFSKGS